MTITEAVAWAITIFGVGIGIYWFIGWMRTKK